MPMYGQLGKFDQRILPMADMVRITPYAVNKAVNREKEQHFQKNKEPKKSFSYEEQITLSISAQEDSDENIFAEYNDVSTWVALPPLLANALMRLKFITLKINESDDSALEISNSSENSGQPLGLHQAYRAYENAVNVNRIENQLSFEEKTRLSQVIEKESFEELQNELENLRNLIPGLQALIDAGYTHIPIIEGNTFLDTVYQANTKLYQNS